MIPKVIHYCWLGGNPLPKSAVKCIESWKKYCPDYEIKEWNEKNLDFENVPDFVRQAYESKAWGFVPDFFRLWIIYNYGGIYLDTDVQMIKNFDSLLDDESFCGFEADEFINFGHGFGAEKNNKMIYEHMKLYDNISFFNPDGTLNKTPSPIITTNWLKSKGVVLSTDKIQTVDGMKIYPADYFSPKSFNTGITRITENTFSIHQYDASWFTDEEKEKLKKSQRDYKLNKIKYAPNKLMTKILGKETYDKLKKIIKH